MPIRYTTEDTRSEEQQRALIRARLRDRKQRAQAARARKQAEQKTLEERVAQLEERLARLGG
ncbi:MAG: hypothetical protein E6J90_50750 [Deltaproteobacteria bacterium]|nr:MAG: hypothetical protein E6J90_50750 [Deltaproteobacteria bacterium]